MNIPTVSIGELREFVLNQPDEREYNNGNGRANLSPGCIMTQYGKHKGWKFIRSSCVSGWLNSRGDYIARLENMGISNIFIELFDFGNYLPISGTYKELKEYLKDENKA